MSIVCSSTTLDTCNGDTGERVITPSWLTGYSEFVSVITHSGILGIENEYLVKGDRPIYLVNIPNRDIYAAIVPEEFSLLNHHNFGRWNTKQSEAPEQYVDLSVLPGMNFGETDDPVNPNLCGIFLITTLFDVDPAYFIVDSWYTHPWLHEFYTNKKEGLTRDELIPLLVESEWQVIHPENIFRQSEECNKTYLLNENDISGQDFLCLYQKYLSKDYVPIVVTDLSKKYGVLTPDKYFHNESSDVVNHWVVVLQIISSKDGFTYVRVYNPFMNREEIYTWNNFYFSWIGNQEFKDMFYVKPNGK